MALLFALCVMSLPKYPEYKDSGVDALGRVPAQWVVFPLKRELAFLTSGSRGWAEHYADEGDLFIRITNLTRDSARLDLRDLQFVRVPEGAEGERTRVQPGDVLFSITAYLGSVAVVPATIGTAYVSQHIALARLRNRQLLPEWVAYFTQSSVGQRLLETAGYGGTKVQLSLDDIANLPIPAPPLEDQYSAVAFLDRETGKIDALIAEQEKLLTLLAEKRQATISHAVTRGLNPNAAMKDSGVPWLGDVPAHWDVLVLRRFINRFEQGWSPECESRPAEPGEWGVLKAGCVNGGEFDANENKALPASLVPRNELELQSGDVLMSRASGSSKLIGSVACVSGTPSGLMLSDKIFRIHLSVDVDPKFFAVTMGSTPLRQQIERAIGGAEGLANNLPQASIKEFWMALPSIGEQRTIIDFLGGAKSKLDALAHSIEHAITLLKERRCALIATAVTGRIDVRTAV